jgi:dTMP kinase
MSGLFITFEGIDGCGKSTQLRMLAELLASRGLHHAVTREPGGTPIGSQIREILLNRANTNLVATAELLLYAADRAQHVAADLRPALAQGQIILCDRYIDATTAYQGYGRQLSLDLIMRLNQIATDGLIPDLTLLFDLDTGVAQERVIAGTALRGQADRIDSEHREFHERVRAGYLKLASQQPARFVIISAQAAPEIIFKAVCAAVAARLPQQQARLISDCQ